MQFPSKKQHKNVSMKVLEKYCSQKSSAAGELDHPNHSMLNFNLFSESIVGTKKLWIKLDCFM